MNTEEANGIWRRRLPPDTAAGIHPVPPDTTNLGQYTRNALLNYMGNPRYAVLIFDYGQTQPTLWQNVPQLDTEAAVIAWYNATFPGAPTPQPRGVIEAKIATLNVVDPIQILINRNKLHALAILHGTGRWNPAGYGISGRSYLSMAWNRRRKPKLRIMHYICRECRKNRVFALERPNCPGLVAGASSETHLDFIIRRDYSAFSRMWSFLDRISLGPGHMNLVPAPGAPLLQRSTLIALSEKVSGPLLTSLRVRNGLDLHAFVPDIWHSALTNPNPNFVDGLAAHPPALATVNNAVIHPANALATAFQWDRFVKFERLLVVGADADAWARSADGIPSWPHARSRSWKYIKAAVMFNRNIEPTPGGQVNGGTLLHVIVRALESQLRQLATLLATRHITPAQYRGRHTTRYRQARALIALVRNGNWLGNTPDVHTTDQNGMTAAAAAQGMTVALGLSLPNDIIIDLS
ncbi:uncharacterized protein BDW70DRAFT_163990 [Aspergillus foveolatus]|uniref:uncharacterized protein n=1 Tax=Aspergillus foveolatus TaxID=210207 RepID=UPI003CCD57CA